LRPAWIFWVDFTLVLVESSAFLIIGYALCRRHPRARYPALIVGAACLLYRVLSSTFPHRFYVTLPHLILTGIITPAGFLVLAAALTLLKNKSRQRIIVAVFSVVLTYYVFCDVAYLAVKGPALSRLRGAWDGVTMRQSTPFTCGPAAAATLLRAWGIRVNEGALAYAARTSFRGTEVPRLSDAVRRFGRYKPLTVKIISADEDTLEELNRPAILLVERAGHPHTVTLLRLTGRKVVVGDPAAGTQELDRADFGREYNWGGRAIVAWRDPEFSRLSTEPPEPALHP
jgi:hypothetical protein